MAPCRTLMQQWADYLATTALSTGRGCPVRPEHGSRLPGPLQVRRPRRRGTSCGATDFASTPGHAPRCVRVLADT